MLPIPQNITIIGLNVHGLLTALMLRKAYNPAVTKITLMGQIEDNQPPKVMLAGNALNTLLAHFGQSETNWMQQTKATFKLSNRYVGFSETPFSVANTSEVDILHQPLMLELTKLKRQHYQLDLTLDDFFFSTALAKRNLSPKAQDFPFETHYQYQVDTNRLLILLQQIAATNSIDIVQKPLETLQFDQQGRLKHVECEGQILSGDYFFDCTGNAKMLIGNMPEFREEPLPEVRINDRVLTFTASAGSCASEVITTALDCGFVQQYSLRGSVHFQYHYSSKFIQDEQALQVLGRHMSQQGYDNVLQRNLSANQACLVFQPWSKNCIAIGPACGLTQGTEDHELAHTFAMLERFVSSIQSPDDVSAVVQDYNDRIKSRFIYIHSFHSTLLLLNARRNSPYWQTPQNPNALTPIGKMLFSQWLNGQDLEVEPIWDINGANAWYALFSGLGHYPKDDTKPHPQASSIQDNIQDMGRKLNGCCLNFESHESQLDEGQCHANVTAV
ncbi:tryptophan 7-halogenase [Alteromonas sp. MMG017]|uniref:tryptophan 7-halogenase n=1 Tax=Alteromonas sp. MMG017 TaxID=2822692 RepID=UPI001B3A779C|nr:tryptophan 7-halogenase [Alteromonas sp. MMG017]